MTTQELTQLRGELTEALGRIERLIAQRTEKSPIRMQSQMFLMLTRLRREDVLDFSEVPRDGFWHASLVMHYLRQNRVSQAYVAFNGLIYRTDEFASGRVRLENYLATLDEVDQFWAEQSEGETDASDATPS